MYLFLSVTAFKQPTPCQTKLFNWFIKRQITYQIAETTERPSLGQITFGLWFPFITCSYIIDYVYDIATY